MHNVLRRKSAGTQVISRSTESVYEDNASHLDSISRDQSKAQHSTAQQSTAQPRKGATGGTRTDVLPLNYRQCHAFGDPHNLRRTDNDRDVDITNTLLRSCHEPSMFEKFISENHRAIVTPVPRLTARLLHSFTQDTRHISLIVQVPLSTLPLNSTPTSRQLRKLRWGDLGR